MSSPFPGMNPYLEQEDAWHDFHERFLPVAAAVIEAQVGANYIVKIDENVYVHDLEDGERRLLGRGDVFVAESHPAGGAGAATAILEAPVTVDLPKVDRERESFIEIRDRRSRRLVTVIELLSPTNKNPGPNREQYLAKRGRLLDGDTNVVEIDLLRGGPRMPMDPPPDCDYLVLVSRAARWPHAGVWPVRLREPLPTVPVPLRPGEAEPRLDLKRILDRVYDDAGYHKYIYDETPQPPLSADDAAWAGQLVSSGAA
ncbi:MAG TPA: DUF4058 family protein [Planctomycetaceae bacterium]|nr:DUF4058 family protein [Planctomycetaceae bacterium]